MQRNAAVHGQNSSMALLQSVKKILSYGTTVVNLRVSSIGRKSVVGWAECWETGAQGI